MNIISGNIFDSKCQALVNTVNCEGFMGKGLALEFRFLYPEMFEQYKLQCAIGAVRTGELTLFKETAPWIINFPTKREWAHPSKMEYITTGLRAFVEQNNHWGLESVAFPILGGQNGGLDPDMVLTEMRSHLSDIDISIEVYQHSFKVIPGYISKSMERLGRLSNAEMKRKRLHPRLVERVMTEYERGEITSFSSMLRLKGIGEGFIDKVADYYRSIQSTTDTTTRQISLF